MLTLRTTFQMEDMETQFNLLKSCVETQDQVSNEIWRSIGGLEQLGREMSQAIGSQGLELTCLEETRCHCGPQCHELKVYSPRLSNFVPRFATSRRAINQIILLLDYLSLTAQTDTQALPPHSRTQVAWIIYVVMTTRTAVPITKTIYHAEHARLRVMRNLPIIRYPL